MTAGEFAFLALGLLLGVASGAAFVAVYRTRPLPPREVRVTVAPDSVPRRGATLATDPFAAPVDGPARGGPADRRALDRPEPMDAAFVAVAAGTIGTVSEAVGQGLPMPAAEPPSVAGQRTDVPTLQGRPWVAVPVVADPAAPPGMPVPAARDAGPSLADASGGGGATAVAVAPPIVTAAWSGSEDDRAAGLVRGSGQDVPRSDDPCAHLVAVAEDRCAVAERAQATANAAAAALHETRRAYDEHLVRAEEAERRSDPRAIRTAKEEAHVRFRASRDTAASREELDAAAATWLEEVNRINAEARRAAVDVERERGRASGLIVTVEQRTIEADAARIAAESAAEACLAARQALADCREAVTRRAAEVPVEVPRLDPYPEDRPELEWAVEGAGSPRILRLLRGDDRAMVELVAELAGSDAEARREWQLAMSGLVDAIVATAIDASQLDLPDDQPFWGLFSGPERREIVAALASLGFRFDGLAGFADGRVPSQRDLSLAVGYAGQDPMRIRIWPDETEMPRLFAGTRVAADDYLAEAAGDLGLGEMVDLLGRRADGLTMVWNDWGRVRPALLATT
ncbi:MAG TPA: hypothetical protein VLA23_06175 [Candidatus Limnocylindrales bacterium]|nr:hypothetical protein [Candidatus Limnocylindrales bacterium]